MAADAQVGKQDQLTERVLQSSRAGRPGAVTEPTPQTPQRRWWKSLLVVAVLALVFLLGFLWYMTTESFQAFVRARIVAEIEKATGARVELGAYHTIPFRLQAEV